MSVFAIELTDVSKAYGKVCALNQLSLKIPKGSVFGLLGPNGAGKSTTFGIIAGWRKYDGGTVTVLGHPVAELPHLNGAVAALPQDAAFPKQLSVQSQLCYFGRLMGMSGQKAQGETNRVLDLVGLPQAKQSKGSELSHGMLKRVGIAQALLGKPQLILLDEPTAGLDPASARQIKDIVAKLAPQATVVISSHNLAEIQEICTHGAILAQGKLTVSGTIADITQQGAEIYFDLEPNAQLPLQILWDSFGSANVTQDSTDDKKVTLCIAFSNEFKSSDIIATASKILLEHQVAILGVRQGKSLESAYMELTSHK